MATTNYQRGRAFEYRTRDKLKERGAVYVMRAAGSHTKADLAAFFPWRPRIRPQEIEPSVWLVQCKRDGKLSRADADELTALCRQIGATPMLAKTGPNGRGVEFERLFQTTSKETQ